MLVSPDAEDVFVLGMGSGISAGALLAYPASNIVVAENLRTCDSRSQDL